MRKKLGLGIAGVVTAAVLVVGVVLLMPGAETEQSAVSEDTNSSTGSNDPAEITDDRVGAAVNGAGSPRSHEPHPGLKPVPSNRLPAPPEGMNGCDPGYGTKSQCVPWHIPPQEEDRCAWLKSDKNVSAVKVNGTDRLGLDKNNDGTACGSGD